MNNEQKMRVQRFSIAIKVIGWQGGTIHQVNNELKVKDLYSLSKDQFIEVLKEYNKKKVAKK